MATKKPGTAIIKWEEEMRAEAVKLAEREKSFEGFKRVQVQGSTLMVDKEPIEGNSLDVIVLGAAPLNEYYAQQYDPQKPTVPDCYAFGDMSLEDPEAEMAPGEVEDKQSEKCADCWANKFGSAERGRGKACKNVKRLLLVTEDAAESAEDLKGAEARVFTISVTNVRTWAAYVKKRLTELQRPYYGVVTTLRTTPDAKNQYALHFDFKSVIEFDQDLWEAMKERHAEAMKVLVQPYPRQADLDARAAESAPARRGPPGRVAPPARKGPPVAAKKTAKY